MTSLEFINDRIKIYETMLLTALNTKCNVEQIRHFEERIKIFQQIKNVLEAWEICKNKKVDIHDIIYCSNSEVYNCGLYKEYQLTQQEHEIIKKVLEVEDEI